MDNHQPCIQNNSNPRIVEDNIRHVSNNSVMSDAALRRGKEESRRQFEAEIVYRSQLDEALRESRTQQHNNSTNISPNRSATAPSSSPVPFQPVSPPTTGQIEDGLMH